jgi:hypothetical protein
MLTPQEVEQNAGQQLFLLLGEIIKLSFVLGDFFSYSKSHGTLL